MHTAPIPTWYLVVVFFVSRDKPIILTNTTLSNLYTTLGSNIRTDWSSYQCINDPYISAHSGTRYTTTCFSLKIYLTLAF